MRWKRFSFWHVGCIALGLCALCTVGPAAPLQFNYQGVLTDSTGNLVTSNNVDFRVSIYDGPVTGTLLHLETFAGQDLSGVPPGSNGVFNLAVGSTTPSSAMSRFPRASAS